MLNKSYKIFISFVLLFIFVSSYFCIFAEEALYVWNSDSVPVNNEQEKAITEETKNQSNSSLQLESGSAILIDQKTGQVLFEHNSHEQLRPASVTKVMTILLIMEALDNGRLTLEDKIPCTPEASSMGGSQIWLDVREELTVNEMLKAICVVSANDCTVAMAEYLAGSQQAFVEQMNAKAKELGMNDTTFKNCHGIDEDGHVTSAYDISLMSRELMNKHPQITNYTTIWMDSLRDGKSSLVNTNKLLRTYKGATGLKTGSTSLALYNLSATATRDDLSLIAVIMKAPTSKIRFEEASKVLDYGFSNYHYKSLAKSNETVNQITVNKGVEPSVDVVFENDCGALLKKGEDKNIVQDMALEETLSAPIAKGQKVGEVSYSIDGNTVARTNLIANQEVKKITLWNMTTHLYETWFQLTRH